MVDTVRFHFTTCVCFSLLQLMSLVQLVASLACSNAAVDWSVVDGTATVPALLECVICACIYISCLINWGVSSALHADSALYDVVITFQRPSFLGRADPTWSEVPTQWYESAFVGNGKLGAMVRVNPADGVSLQLDIGSSAVWDDRPPGAPYSHSPDNMECTCIATLHPTRLHGAPTPHHSRRTRFRAALNAKHSPLRCHGSSHACRQPSTAAAWKLHARWVCYFKLVVPDETEPLGRRGCGECRRH